MLICILNFVLQGKNHLKMFPFRLLISRCAQYEFVFEWLKMFGMSHVHLLRIIIMGDRHGLVVFVYIRERDTLFQAFFM